MFRITFLTSVMLFVLTTAFSQTPPLESFAVLPAGNLVMSKHNFSMSSFSISKTEISNKEYQKFLEWLKKNDSPEKLTQATPNLSKEQLKLLPKNYLKSKKYDDFPVVGISMQAADMYCKYLNAIHPEIKGTFRLPSEREWVYASRGGNDLYAFSSGMAMRDKEQNFVCNYKSTNKIPAPMLVNSFKPNGFGLYNMSGNVAEWLNLEGRTKGGSWNDTEEFLNVTGKDAYMGLKEPSPFVGFRVLWIAQ